VKKDLFPDLIKNLPISDLPVEGLHGWLVPSEYILVSILEADSEVIVPEHSHGAQWGVVLDGTVELTIGGVKKVYETGDNYYIPSDVKHSGILSPGHRAIDFFEDLDRYKPKS
jgi:hypothetical protein